MDYFFTKGAIIIITTCIHMSDNGAICKSKLIVLLFTQDIPQQSSSNDRGLFLLQVYT